MDRQTVLRTTVHSKRSRHWWLFIGLAAAQPLLAALAQTPSGEPPATAATAGGLEAGQALDLSLPPAETVAPLSAPDSFGDAGAMSLAQALNRAWRDNPQVLQAMKALEATGYDISGARTGYLPYVSYSAAQSRGGSSVIDGRSTVVSVVQPLWSGGSTGALVAQAKAKRQTALADFNNTRLQLGLKTAEAYLNVAASQELDQQWQKYIAELQRLLGVIQRRAKEGAAPQADVETALARLRQAQSGAEANRAVYEANRAQLESLILARPDTVYWPPDNTRLSDEEVSGAGTVGIQGHPVRQTALAQLAAQDASTRQAKAALWPQVSLQFKHQISGEILDPSNDDVTSLALSYQTDNGLKGFLAYKAEQQRAESAQARYQAAIREVDASIRVARAQRQAALLQIASQEEATRSTSALVDSFIRQFEVGRKTWLEVLNAQREANEQVLQLVSVRRGFWLANAQLALQALYWRRLSDAAPVIEYVGEGP